MARDTRRLGASRPATPPRRRPRSCVWWFLLGTMLGSFGVGLYWMSQAPTQVAPPVATIPAPERPTPPPPKYQFQDLLRDTTVEIGKGKPPPPPAPRPEPITNPEPDPELDAKPQADAAERTAIADKPKTPEKPEKPEKVASAPEAPSGTYILQVGSFRTARDAENMKAQLALLGVSTRVQAVTIKNGQVWHRVMTGPLASKKVMEQTRATLQRHGKESMPVKVK